MDDSATEVQEVRMSDTFEGGRAVEVLQVSLLRGGH